FDYRLFVVGKVGSPGGPSVFQNRLDLIEDLDLTLGVLVAGRFCGPRSLVPTLFDACKISKGKLDLNGFDITHRIPASLDMDTIVVLKASYDLNYSVGLADICVELIAKALAFG